MEPTNIVIDSGAMATIIIGFLAIAAGIFGGLLKISSNAGSRFTALETNMQWVKETLQELKTASDNERNPAYASQSPVNLNAKGEEWLRASGLKEYLDQNKAKFLTICESKRTSNPYDIQQHIFSYFDNVEFEENLDKSLKEFAFEKGTTMNIMRRVAAIYFRNICLDEFGMEKADIDIHDPGKNTKNKDNF